MCCSVAVFEALKDFVVVVESSSASLSFSMGPTTETMRLCTGRSRDGVENGAEGDASDRPDGLPAIKTRRWS